MSTPPSTIDRARPYSVPAAIAALVAVAVLALPPLLLDLSSRTYALTAAWVILAVGATIPYALTVAILTTPFSYLGIATYASPSVLTERGESPPAMAVVRHGTAGFAYVLAAGIVGAIGLGADFATANESAVPTDVLPSFMLVAGGVVAACFVALQLWRHDATPDGLDARRVAGTVVLGLFLVPAGRVALWVFQQGI